MLYYDSFKTMPHEYIVACLNKLDFNKQSSISVVYIVKNEKAVILKSLESLEGLADEVIIVDTGSDDGTIELIKELSQKDTSIKSYTYEWCDDFSKARNFANEKANGDWILSLDADEQVTDFKSLKLLLTYVTVFGDYDNTVFNLNIVRGEKYYKTGKIIQNLPCFSYQGRVHETYVSSVNDVCYANLDIDIISRERMTVEKLGYYNDLLLKTIKDNPSNPRWIYLYFRGNLSSINYLEMKSMSNAYLSEDGLFELSEKNFKENYYNVRIVLLLMFKALQVKKWSDFETYRQLIDSNSRNCSDYVFLNYAFSLLKIQEMVGNSLISFLKDSQTMTDNDSIFSIDYLNAVLGAYLFLDGNLITSKEIFEKLSSNSKDFPSFLPDAIMGLLLG